jgi:hypothetical protein
MAEFDREELKAAFEAGKIAVSDDNIRRLDDLLRALTRQYRARKIAREQDLNGHLATVAGNCRPARAGSIARIAATTPLTARG